jgi:hypothetical protein
MYGCSSLTSTGDIGLFSPTLAVGVGVSPEFSFELSAVSFSSFSIFSILSFFGEGEHPF